METLGRNCRGSTHEAAARQEDDELIQKVNLELVIEMT